MHPELLKEWRLNKPLETRLLRALSPFGASTVFPYPFSMEFSEHLKATEATFEGRRTVIEGLDVTVEVFRKDGAIYLRCRSILSPKPREILLTVLHTP